MVQVASLEGRGALLCGAGPDRSAVRQWRSLLKLSGTAPARALAIRMAFVAAALFFLCVSSPEVRVRPR